jgi:glycerol-3-phosphate cytidylyltransferase
VGRQTVTKERQQTMDAQRRTSFLIGYTTGVFDLFHVGHLNVLRRAKGLCDKLIVGVTTDSLLMEYKNKKALMPFDERVEIVASIQYVDTVVPQDSLDKLGAWNKLRFDVMFVGDDWHNTPKWREYERQLQDVGVRVVYFPYTKGVSSTLLNRMVAEKREEMAEEERRGGRRSGNG